MKKELIFIISTALLCFITNLYLPWWFTAIVTGFTAYFLGLHAGKSFVLASLTVGLLWLLMSLFQYEMYSSNITTKISEIFMNIGVSKLFLVTTIIGGITAGLGAWTGAALKHNFNLSEE